MAAENEITYEMVHAWADRTFKVRPEPKVYYAAVNAYLNGDDLKRRGAVLVDALEEAMGIYEGGGSWDDDDNESVRCALGMIFPDIQL